VAPRAEAVCRYADLRPTDRVLDVGCGEGEVALEVAKRVEHVHGFDISAERVAQAARSAAARDIRNATFEAVSIQDFPFEPLSWDVSLFMRVWGKSPEREKRAGVEELDLILRATRRQLIMLAAKHIELELAEMLDVCNENQFDALCFTRPDFFIANRRGAGVRVGELPALAVVPTAWLQEHPVGAGSIGRRGRRSSRVLRKPSARGLLDALGRGLDRLSLLVPSTFVMLAPELI
jgi:SAM-dependent methyltransferase